MHLQSYFIYILHFQYTLYIFYDNVIQHYLKFSLSNDLRYFNIQPSLHYGLIHYSLPEVNHLYVFQAIP